MNCAELPALRSACRGSVASVANKTIDHIAEARIQAGVRRKISAEISLSCGGCLAYWIAGKFQLPRVTVWIVGALLLIVLLVALSLGSGIIPSDGDLEPQGAHVAHGVLEGSYLARPAAYSGGYKEKHVHPAVFGKRVHPASDAAIRSNSQERRKRIVRLISNLSRVPG